MQYFALIMLNVVNKLEVKYLYGDLDLFFLLVQVVKETLIVVLHLLVPNQVNLSLCLISIKEVLRFCKNKLVVIQAIYLETNILE